MSRALLRRWDFRGWNKRGRGRLTEFCRPATSSAPADTSTGYVVLLPEEPADTAETNSLLNVKDKPQFDKLSTTNYFNALGKLALEVEAKVWKIEENLKDGSYPRTYETVLQPLEESSASLDYVWSVLKTLNLVKNNYFPTDAYQRIHDRARQARSKKFVSLPIYFACKEINSDSDKLNDPQCRTVEKFLLEGGLSGAEVTGNAAVQLRQTLNKLEESRVKFRQNLEKATVGFKHMIVEPKYVGEMPTHLLKHLAKDRSQPNKGPWVVRLTNPVYKAFLEYCPEAGVRWNAWNACNTRASGYSEKTLNNSAVIEEIRSSRAEQANLLGFNSYVELSMETKMAETEDNVQSMLATLFSHASPKQQEEFENLKTFAASRGFEGILRPWDVDFWRRRQRQALFNIDEENIRQYFPFPEVWKSLCSFADELFGVEIRKADAPVWEEDVFCYDVVDKQSNQKIASFYLDPYSRPGEKVGKVSWMVGNRTRCGNINPLATLVLNLAPPMYGKPSLLNFDDVHTLFGKFGQLLQHVLSTVPYHEVSGTNYMEWDAVFVAEKFMTMWLGNKSIIREITSHFENGSKMPDEMIRNLLRSQKHMAASDLCHELYLSALDIDLYSKKDFWMDIMKKLWPVYHAPLQLDKRDMHVCSFEQIFSRDFAAAYYSKLWSHMLAADIYQQFVEKGQSRDAWKIHGQRLRDSLLAMGGGYHPNKVFRKFRGRDPSLDSILWTLGLKPMTVVEGEALQEDQDDDVASGQEQKTKTSQQ